MFSMHLFLEWLAGLSGTSEYQEEVSKIVRVVVAGIVFFIPFKFYIISFICIVCICIYYLLLHTKLINMYGTIQFYVKR